MKRYLDKSAWVRLCEDQGAEGAVEEGFECALASACGVCRVSIRFRVWVAQGEGFFGELIASLGFYGSVDSAVDDVALP